MTSLSRLVWVLGSGAIVAGLAAHAAADEVASSGFGLAQVVKVTLSASPELKLATAQVEIADGALTVSRAAFDLKLATTATAARTNVLDPTGAPAVQKDLIYTAHAERLLRNGVVITPELSLARSILSNHGVDTNTADVRLGVSIPLLRERGDALLLA